MEFLYNLKCWFMEPLLYVDLGLLFQVQSVWCAGLTLHLRMLGQLQLLKALELWDSTESQMKKQMIKWHEDTKMKNPFCGIFILS